MLVDLLGEPPTHWHPVAWFGRYLTWVKRREGTPIDLLWTGANALTLGCLVVSAVAWSITWALHLFPLWLSLPLTALALKPSFSLTALLRAGHEVRSALEQADLSNARVLLAYHLVSRDTRQLSDAEVAGATIESLAENLSDSVVAPFFYFVLFGLTGAWVYRFVNTADAMLGYREGKLEHLGKAAARLDDLLNLIPARLSALMLCLAAPLIGASARRAWRTAWQDAKRTPSPNAGWPMAAAAGGLGVRLDKREVYVLNPEGRAPTAEDIRLSIHWIRPCSLLTVLLLGAAHLLWTLYG